MKQNQNPHYNQKADYEVFMQQLPSLLKSQRDRVAVVHEGKIVGFYDGMEEAVAFGDSEFGPEQFIAQEVQEEDNPILSYSLAI